MSTLSTIGTEPPRLASPIGHRDAVRSAVSWLIGPLHWIVRRVLPARRARVEVLLVDRRKRTHLAGSALPALVRELRVGLAHLAFGALSPPLHLRLMLDGATNRSARRFELLGRGAGS